MHAYSCFKHIIWNTQLGSRVHSIIGIYNPQFNNSNFIDQFTDLLTEELPKHQDLIILGDINININTGQDQDAQTLLNTIAAFNIKQHVNIPTHNLGCTLDLIITPATYHGLLIVEPYVSDPRFITLETSHRKPKPKLEKRTLQKFTDDAITQFKSEFNNTPILESTTLDTAANQLQMKCSKPLRKLPLSQQNQQLVDTKNLCMMKT